MEAKVICGTNFNDNHSHTIHITEATILNCTNVYFVTFNNVSTSALTKTGQRAPHSLQNVT